MFIFFFVNSLLITNNEIFFHLQSAREDSDEAAMTRKLLDLIVKKTNGHFDKFCKALHEAGQTYVVHNLLVTPGTVIVSK